MHRNETLDFSIAVCSQKTFSIGKPFTQPKIFNHQPICYFRPFVCVRVRARLCKIECSHP